MDATNILTIIGVITGSSTLPVLIHHGMETRRPIQRARAYARLLADDRHPQGVATRAITLAHELEPADPARRKPPKARLEPKAVLPSLTRNTKPAQRLRRDSQP